MANWQGAAGELEPARSQGISETFQSNKQKNKLLMSEQVEVTLNQQLCFSQRLDERGSALVYVCEDGCVLCV